MDSEYKEKKPMPRIVYERFDRWLQREKSIEVFVATWENYYRRDGRADIRAPDRR